MIHLLVTYDVRTTDADGPRPLRRVARVCEDYGQRVQYSVFECQVGEVEFAKLRQRLLDEVDPTRDSLRIYRLPANATQRVEAYGVDRSIDFQGPLIV